MNLMPRQWSVLFSSFVMALLLCASFTSPAQAQCGQFTDSVRALPYPGQEYDSLYKCGDSPYTVVNQSLPGGVTVTFNGGILLATTSGPGYYTTNLLPCNPGFGPQLTISFSQPVANVWVETNRYGFYYYPSTGQTSISIPAPIDANGKWNFGLFNIYFDATNSSSAPKAGTLVANPASGVPGSTVQVTGAGWVNVLNGEYHLLFDGLQVQSQPVGCFTQPNMFFEVPAAAPGAHTITCQLVDTTTQQVVISNQINFNVPCTPQAGTIATDVTSGLPGATVNLTGTGWQTGTGNIYQIALDGVPITGAVQSPASCTDQPQITFDIPCQTPPGTHQLTCRLVNSSTQQVVAESSPPISFTVIQPTTIGPLATTCLPTITFQYEQTHKPIPDPLRIGITVDKDIKGKPFKKPHTRTQHLEAVIPAQFASQIRKIDITSSNTAKMKVTNVKVTKADTITFDVDGLMASDKNMPKGDVSIIATLNKTPIGAAKVVVVVPSKTSPMHDVTGTKVIANRACNISTRPTLVDVDDPKDIELITLYTRDLTITVLDQYDQPLGDLYTDAEVSESNKGANMFFSINSPLSSKGTYLDYVGGFGRTFNVVSINDTDAIKAWEQMQVPPLPAGAKDGDTQNYDIKVDGFPLDPGIINRKWEVTAPDNVTITWP